jgi:hypothetical protein
MKFAFIFCFLLTVPGVLRAQQEQEMSTSQDSETQLEHHTSEDEEQLLHELEAAKAKQAETALKIEKTKDDLANVGSGAIAELQKSGELSLDSIGKMDEKTISFLQEKLRDAHMDRVPADQVRAAILSKSEGKPLGKLFKSYPKLLDVCVDIVRDAEALPAFVGILGKKERLKNYFYVWLGLFILSFLIKRYIFPKKWSGPKRFFAGTFMSLLFLSISLSVFYQLFEKELSPILNVMKKHF